MALSDGNGAMPDGNMPIRDGNKLISDGNNPDLTIWSMPIGLDEWNKAGIDHLLREERYT